MSILRQSITAKITLLVLGSTLLILAVVVDLMYRSSRELIREEAETSARNLVSSLANQIEQEFLVVAEATAQLAVSLEASKWDESTLLDQIQAMVAGNSKVQGSSVAFLPFAFSPGIERFAPYFFKAGDRVEFIQLGREAYDYFNRNWFRIPVETGAARWSEPHRNPRAENGAMTTYSRPMSRKSTDESPPKLVAVVTGDISLHRLNSLLSEKRIYSSGFCFVLSKKGTFVSHPNPDLVLNKSIFDVAEQYSHPRAREIANAMITEQSGFYDIGPAITGKDSYLAFDRIKPPDWALGAVLPKDELFAKVDDLRQSTLGLGAFGIALLAVAAFLVARSISRPLRRMAGETVKVSEGNLDIDLSTITSNDEVGQLARSFSRMTEGLKERERIKDTFGRYLTQEVVKRLLDSKDGLKLGGEIREISIMMSDLRGFTALSSSMSPEQVIKFLNRYLGKMVEIILDHHGIIDEIIGDGILAFFGAPESLDNHPELAVACALRMQLAMEELNALNEVDGLPHLEMGIAVNTGNVVVGNIGSEKRAKYGAVGAQVNFTGRMESYTVGGQVIISRHTYEVLSDKLDIEDILRVEMKGVPGTVDLFDVRGIRGKHEAFLERRDDTLVEAPDGITVKYFGMNQKILSGAGNAASITHASLKSARLVSQKEIIQWDDLQIVIGDDNVQPEGCTIYAKVLSVQPSDGGFAALVRFTSVSPQAYALLRELIKKDS